jgi:hypothetical protein
MANTSLAGSAQKAATFGNDLTGNIKAWAIVWGVLFAGVYFDETAPLAAAFAWLVLVAAILYNGDKAFIQK